MKKLLIFFGLLNAFGLGAIALGVPPIEGVTTAQAEAAAALTCSKPGRGVEEGYGVTRVASAEHCPVEN